MFQNPEVMRDIEAVLGDIIAKEVEEIFELMIETKLNSCVFNIGSHGVPILSLSGCKNGEGGDTRIN